MKTLQQLTLLLLTLIQFAGISQVSDLDIFPEKYNSILKEQNKGIAILVKKNNKIETTSLGNFNLSENSVFNIGSATKTFTAILIMQEIEKGNLRLTDSIGSYLTPIQNVDGDLLIKELLSHESGLDEVIGRNILDIFYAKNDSIYNLSLLNNIEKSKAEIKGKFDYCNTNYLLLGKILEKITDQSYFDLLRERIFIPLQMNNTYPYIHKNLPNLARPYHDNTDVTEYLDFRFFANIANSAGSIASTLIDMEKFYSSLFETEILLRKETVKMMMESGNEAYGLGVFKHEINNQIYYGHGGNNIGYAFRNLYNPITKDMYLMFSNSITIQSRELIKNDLMAFLNDKAIDEFKSIDIKNFEECVGIYLLKEANLKLEIVIEEGKMFLIVESQGVKSELAQKNETSFYDTVVGVTFTMIEDSNDSLSFNQKDFTTTISKVIADN
jgi:CubicO group peptidase (beta-lactamase class C family)